MAPLSDYAWMIPCGALAAFCYGFGTGSNDVANAFGTSVGAKTLNLKQAVIIAAIFEFVGAMVLGRVSVSTIAGGIADINVFMREPEFYAYGMLCALTISAIWQIFSSYVGFNTSSTHSIIGCIIGFSFTYAGSAGVNWYTPDSTAFPPVKGVVPIIISWFFSPIFCCITSSILFSLLKFCILRKPWGYKASVWLLPFWVFVVFLVCIFFVFSKGAKKSIEGSDDTWSDNKSLWVAAACSAGCAAIAAVGAPFLQKMAERKFQKQEDEAAAQAEAEANKDGAVEVYVDKEGLEINMENMTIEEKAAASKAARIIAKEKAHEALMAEDNSKPWYIKYARKAYRAAMHGMEVDVFEIVDDDPMIAKLHAHAEVFHPRVEFVFAYLQVFSACCVMFSHGAGEVGYMSGPLGSIINIVDTGMINKKTEPITWAVAVGALGLIIGLATYGYNVVRAMGVKLAKLSPTRGFCAEISTAFVILIAAQYGLPTSSSQVITGGIIGIGLCEGVVGVNWNFFAVQFSSWIGTLFICSICTSALFSMGAYAPCIQMGKIIIQYEDDVTAVTTTMIKAANSLLARYNQSAISGIAGPLTSAQVANLAKYLASANSLATTEVGTKVQTAQTAIVLRALYRVMSVVQNNSIMTLGQPTIFPGARMCFNGTLNGTACTSPPLLPSSLLQKI